MFTSIYLTIDENNENISKKERILFIIHIIFIIPKLKSMPLVLIELILTN